MPGLTHDFQIEQLKERLAEINDQITELRWMGAEDTSEYLDLLNRQEDIIIEIGIIEQRKLQALNNRSGNNNNNNRHLNNSNRQTNGG